MSKPTPKPRPTPPQKDHKQFMGVPVLPGMSPKLQKVDIREDSDNEYNETKEAALEDRQSIASSSSFGAVSGVGTSISPGYQMVPAVPETRSSLRHIDFMPGMIKEKSIGDDEFNKFNELVEKANTWLREHRFAQVLTCESVQWMTIDKPVYSDNGILHKSMSSDKRTRMLRGLRVWYIVLDDTYYNADTLPTPSTIGHMNYLPESKNESMRNILKRLNDDLCKTPFRGQFLKVESLHILSDLDADISAWREQPEKDRQYNTFLRIFYIEKVDEPTRYNEIGMHDFLPRYEHRTIHNQGYEVYSDMWKRVCRWLHTNHSLRCLNIQSVFVKFKKDSSEKESFQDRCTFTEHGCSHGSGNQKTEYMQIIRVVYCFVPATKGHVPEKITYKTFTPARIKREHSVDKDEEIDANCYEDLRQTEEKINSWLAFSGAKVVGVDTVPVRLRTGGQETLGPEATFVLNNKEKKNASKELWRNNIRLYIEGEYRQTPVVWSRQIVEYSQSIVTSNDPN